eukprot:CAMPEP_0173410804 /NCGR_PEP_ID=MMETSP1356-20130122/75445_1 /TAXON_ID=77927 ORGANISM="Hemiselmis virescens, Strain PCC157" /NCGR_SAMPLE_ID=MMETSP1356 /ASSEMBLY_ACC=CAM_ASM_000847 /LENGTH=79 /DNA_ID=CAMNT_0014372463 /DNA_START=81 /DNA_END=320 /DNA_ORIENTATION=+
MIDVSELPVTRVVSLPRRTQSLTQSVCPSYTFADLDRGLLVLHPRAVPSLLAVYKTSPRPDKHRLFTPDRCLPASSRSM